MTTDPLLSIITIVLNDRVGFQLTMESVVNQTLTNYEYLVIDGGSTDGTQEAILKHASCITKWISEPDNGIYDAMNKGLSQANGTWILFLNAGDKFFAPHTLEHIFSSGLPEKSDVIFGDVIIKYQGLQKERKAGQLRHIHRGMQFSHQSCLIRTFLVKSEPFDPTYTLTADYKLIYSLYFKGYRFTYHDKVISCITAGGISDTARMIVLKEYERIVRSTSVSWMHSAYFSWMRMRAVTVFYIKKILPLSVVNRIRKSR